MRGRKLTKKIEIWVINSVADGYGGFTVNESLLTSTWANIKTLQVGRQNNVTQFGVVDANNSIIITVRKRNDLMYNEETIFVKYRGVKYTISTAPTNVDFDDNMITFAAIAESTKTNEA